MQQQDCGGMWIDQHGPSGSAAPLLSRFLTDKPALDTLRQWVDTKYAQRMKEKDEKRAGASIATVLTKLLRLDAIELGDLDIQIIGEQHNDTYHVRSLTFQTQKGIYVPADLYIPEGAGPFPALLNSHGHWDGAKMGTIVQQTALRFVRAGYVVLCLDAWGAGARGTNQQEEYHGANLGASLFDAGTSLLALQLMDNHQAINLLCSLSFVDRTRIGAIGASGGGNQTLWISAYDKRIRAALPVVSVGTFRGYLLQCNCVCELLPGGLQLLEAHDVIGAIAPRSVRIFSALQEDIPAFQTGQMMNVYERAKPYYRGAGAETALSYELFDEPHDFTPRMQQAGITFFDQQFGRESTDSWPDEEPIATASPALNTVVSPVTFQTTLNYVVERQMPSVAIGTDLPPLVPEDCKKELKRLLAVDDTLQVKDCKVVADAVAGWTCMTLTVTDGQQRRLLLKKGKAGMPTQFLVPSTGFSSLTATQLAIYQGRQEGVVLLEVFGMQEQQENVLEQLDKGLPAFHSLSRTFLWLGETLMGRWIAEIKLVMDYLHAQGVTTLHLCADRETGLAVLGYQALFGGASQLQITQLALSMLPAPGDKQAIELNMAMHVPGILPWGDISLLRALVTTSVEIQEPINMAGQRLSAAAIAGYAEDVARLRKRLK